MPEPKKRSKGRKRGPEAERVKVEGDWSAAIKKALEKKRPAEGWPGTRKRKGRD